MKTRRIEGRGTQLGPCRPIASSGAARTLVAVAALVGLAACADEPTSARAPLPAAPAASGPATRETPGVAVGGYRLTISGIGTSDETSTVVADAGPAEWVDVPVAAAVAPGDRGLTPRPSTTYSLQLQRVINGSFAVGTRGDPSAYRYVFAIFRVRNGGLVAGGSVTLTNLSLMAISTASSLGSTAISNLARADGTAPSNGPTIARAMIPAGASGLGRTGTLTALRTDVLQIFSEADAKSVAITSPYTALAYGFTVLDTVTDGRAIATSAAGNYPGLVLFAFKVPLQATAAEDIFTFSFNFFAVTDAETRVTQSMEERDAASAAAVSARASAIGASEIHVLSGSTLAGLASARTFCGYRIAGAGTFVSPGVYAGTDCSSDFASIGVTPGTAILPPGATRQLTAVATPAAGSTTPTALSYQSDNPAIATVSTTGFVTAVGPGAATIYVSTFASPRTVAAVIQVDNAPPTLLGVGLTSFTNADQARIGGAVPAQSFAINIFDNIGYSFTPISGTLSRLRRSPDTEAGAVVTECVTSLSGTAPNQTPNFASITSQPGGVCPTVSFPLAFKLTGLAGGDASAQYTFTGRPVDVAGNQGSVFTARTSVDVIAPTVTAIDIPNTLTGGAAASFGLSGSDNLELLGAYPTVQYGSAFALRNDEVTIGTLFDGVLANVVGGLSLPVSSFVRSVTLTTGGVPAGAAPTAASAVVASVSDAGDNVASLTAPFGAGVVQGVPAGPVFATGVAATNVAQFAFATVDPSTGNPTAANPVVTSSPGGANQYASVTLRSDQSGASSYASPFQRVELYVRVGTVNGAPQYRFVGTFPAGTTTDIDQASRRVRTELSLTPASFALLAGSAAGTAYELRAVGITASGDALVSGAINVTVRTP